MIFYSDSGSILLPMAIYTLKLAAQTNRIHLASETSSVQLIVILFYFAMDTVNRLTAQLRSINNLVWLLQQPTTA